MPNAIHRSPLPSPSSTLINYSGWRIMPRGSDLTQNSATLAELDHEDYFNTQHGDGTGGAEEDEEMPAPAPPPPPATTAATATATTTTTTTTTTTSWDLDRAPSTVPSSSQGGSGRGLRFAFDEDRGGDDGSTATNGGATATGGGGSRAGGGTVVPHSNLSEPFSWSDKVLFSLVLASAVVLKVLSLVLNSQEVFVNVDLEHTVSNEHTLLMRSDVMSADFGLAMQNFRESNSYYLMVLLLLGDAVVPLARCAGLVVAFFMDFDHSRLWVRRQILSVFNVFGRLAFVESLLYAFNAVLLHKMFHVPLLGEAHHSRLLLNIEMYSVADSGLACGLVSMIIMSALNVYLVHLDDTEYRANFLPYVTCDEPPSRPASTGPRVSGGSTASAPSSVAGAAPTPAAGAPITPTRSSLLTGSSTTPRITGNAAGRRPSFGQPTSFMSPTLVSALGDIAPSTMRDVVPPPVTFPAPSQSQEDPVRVPLLRSGSSRSAASYRSASRRVSDLTEYRNARRRSTALSSIFNANVPVVETGKRETLVQVLDRRAKALEVDVLYVQRSGGNNNNNNNNNDDAGSVITVLAEPGGVPWVVLHRKWAVRWVAFVQVFTLLSFTAMCAMPKILSFKMSGLAGIAFDWLGQADMTPEERSSSYTGWVDFPYNSLVTRLPKYSGPGSTWHLLSALSLATFFFIILVLIPLVLWVLSVLIWFVPLTATQRMQLCNSYNVVEPWASTQILFVAWGGALLEMHFAVEMQLTDIVGDALCDGIKHALHVPCVKLESRMDWGFAVMALAVGFLVSINYAVGWASQVAAGGGGEE